MSGEIKLQPEKVRQGLVELRTSIETLEKTFAKDMEGRNNLDMVNLFNEIKNNYDELFTRYSSLMQTNVQDADMAIADFIESETMVASEIRMMK